VVRALREDGVDVVVLDDLSTGDASRVGDTPLVRASLLDRAAVDRVLVDHEVSGVVHIAAKKQVGESVEDPYYYYRQNVLGQLTLMEAMRDSGVRRFVFSSSSATYGAPDTAVVEEKAALEPESPYGQTKVVGEWLAADAEAAYGVRSVCLRYFNVAGAAAPELGDPEALNLIPMVFQRLTARQAPQIFGDDYPTPDGTCIRDYIHVADIATAWSLCRTASMLMPTTRWAPGSVAADRGSQSRKARPARWSNVPSAQSTNRRPTRGSTLRLPSVMNIALPS
jgi:UDP-glucose 4-epimerase